MTLPLDHLVILVKDLSRAIDDYASLGFTVQRGGTHADGRTHNALIGFEDGSFIELIAFLADAPDHRWAPPAAAGHEGFVDFALLPPADGGVAAVIAAARARNLLYEGPIDGGRVRPDGTRLKWQIATPPSPDLPFLCGDVTPRSLRVRDGDVRDHPNGARGVDSLTLAVGDVDRTLGRYQALLGEPLPLASPLMAPGQRHATVPLGATTLHLVASGAHAEGLSGAALISRQLRTPRLLPLTATHGARIELQSGFE